MSKLAELREKLNVALYDLIDNATSDKKRNTADNLCWKLRADIRDELEQIARRGYAETYCIACGIDTEDEDYCLWCSGEQQQDYGDPFTFPSLSDDNIDETQFT